MNFLTKKTRLGFAAAAIIASSIFCSLQSQELIESFNAGNHEITVKLWIDGTHHKTAKAYPLSINRNLHSFWGSLIAASDGRLYLPPATHSDLGASIWLVRFDPRTSMMDMVFEARKQFGHQIGADGLWDSKIHTGVKEGKDGKLYFAGMIGGSYATMYTHMVHPSAYMGGHLYQYDLKTGQTQDLGIPHRYASIIAADLDVERDTFYMLAWPQSEFLIYSLKDPQCAEPRNRHVSPHWAKQQEASVGARYVCL